MFYKIDYCLSRNYKSVYLHYFNCLLEPITNKNLVKIMRKLTGILFFIAIFSIISSCKDSYGIDPNIKETQLERDTASRLVDPVVWKDTTPDPPRRIRGLVTDKIITEHLYFNEFPSQYDEYLWFFSNSENYSIEIEIDTNLWPHAYYLRLFIKEDSSIVPDHQKRPVLIREFYLNVDSLVPGFNNIYGDSVEVLPRQGDINNFKSIISYFSNGTQMLANISDKCMPVMVMARLIRIDEVNKIHEAEIYFNSFQFPEFGKRRDIFLTGRIIFKY